MNRLYTSVISDLHPRFHPWTEYSQSTGGQPYDIHSFVYFVRSRASFQLVGGRRASSPTNGRQTGRGQPSAGFWLQASSSLRARRRDEEEEEEAEQQHQRRAAGGSVAVAVDRMNLVLWVGLKDRGFITVLPSAEAWDTLA
ncbi:unnamed protein product [Sphagnum jensenii]|uniref:Uncharacterized protein n=1 Tax=Sphagnum jensenii TaxID=128206 RepID=A0ABP0XBE2_9BRYO